MPSLLIIEGPLAGERIEVEAELVVGRGDADLVIEDAGISRRHLVFRPADEAVEVEDLDSLNGTSVNGVRIVEPTRLAAGDVVRLGGTAIEALPAPRRAAETVVTPSAATTVVSPAVTRVAGAGQEPPPVPAIVVLTGPLAGERIEVDADVVLGRASGDVVIADPELSRRHLVLRRVAEAVEIEDLDSLNGTWVNGARITGPTRIESGDTVRLGATQLALEAPPAEGGRAPAAGGRATSSPPVAVSVVTGPQPAAARRRPSPQSLARAASSRPWTVVGIWAAILVASVATIGALLGSALTSALELTNDPESQRAEALADEQFGDGSLASEVVIVRSASSTVDDAPFRRKVQELAARLERTDAVVATRTFVDDETLVSSDRRATLIPLVLRPGAEEESGVLTETLDIVAAAEDTRFEVGITGQRAADADLEILAQEDLKTGELFFGAPAALLVLLLVFGTVVAGLIPLLMAIVSIIVTLAIVAIAGQGFAISLFVVNMVTAMGLALGIDYSLFILSRYREERRVGRDRRGAIAASGATAGRAVMFSGLAFVLALVGMVLVPDLVLRSLAVGAITVGLVSLTAALTLLPAVLALLGDRVNALRIPVVGRRVTSHAGQEGRFWGAIVRAVIARPVVSLVLSASLLVAAALPILDYETGFSGTSTLPDHVTSKRGFVMLNESFPGSTAEPALILVRGNTSASDVQAGVGRLQALLERDPAFGPPAVERTPSGDATKIVVSVPGDSQGGAAIAAVERLRETVIPQAFAGVDADVLVGGVTAKTIDYTETTGFWMPIVFAFVLGLSFILLTVAFRSIVVPLKAIVLNLLSVGAAYGLLVLVFVKGVGADLLGFQQAETIVAWVPLFLFSVLFGLSMDYHVFLLSRIRERFVATGDNDHAVEYGVSTTARLITGASLIIIVVFTGFAMGDLVMFQQMGFGIAVALFIDATIIRSVLVPASMKLLGKRNWYLPPALRWMPDVAVEGAEPTLQPSAAKGSIH